MRDSAVIIVGLLLIGGCSRMYVDPAPDAAEQKQDLADCTAQADQQPLRYPNPRLPPGSERKAQVVTFVENCMATKGYQSQTVLSNCWRCIKAMKLPQRL
jgi:hypothetical protein